MKELYIITQIFDNRTLLYFFLDLSVLANFSVFVMYRVILSSYFIVNSRAFLS